MYSVRAVAGVGSAVDWGGLISSVSNQFLAERQAKLDEARARRQLALEKAQRRQSLQTFQQAGASTIPWVPIVLAGGVVLALTLARRKR